MKITITRDKIEAAKPLPEPTTREKLTVRLDVTGLTRAEVAESLLQLAISIDQPTDADAAEELRRKITARDSTLVTTTRLGHEPPEAQVVFGPDDRVLGSAVFYVEEPLKLKPKKRRGHTRRTARTLFPSLLEEPLLEEELLEEETDDEDEPEWDGTYSNGDKVEFWHRDVWYDGIICGQTGSNTYDVEDEAGEVWESNTAALRYPEEERSW